ncbi:MAG: PAC2 family protein [Acidimicrobiales bacterium]
MYRLEADVALQTPVLVVALEGWVDAGFGSAGSLACLLRSETVKVATFDGDHFLDQRARRPMVHLHNGVNTDITWPETSLRATRDADGSDVLVLLGPEPDFHWASFVEGTLELAKRFGVRLAVGLGCFPAPAPHTRAVRLVATGAPRCAGLIEAVGRNQGDLEVPAGIGSVMELAFAEAGIDMVTLWARVPHYLAATSFPDASVALVEGLASLTGLRFDTTELVIAAGEARLELDQAIASNDDHVTMLAHLEAVVDAEQDSPLDAAELPTADELAAELERFLEGHDRGHP